MNKNVENFKELDIRVGKIISAEEFPEIKKPSYLLNIDSVSYTHLTLPTICSV